MLLDFNKLHKKYSLNLKGVIHIGAHEGQEYSLYKELNIENIFFIEPQPDIFMRLKNNVSVAKNVECINIALGNHRGEVEMFVDSYNQASSSILEPSIHSDQYPHIKFETKIKTKIDMLDNIMEGNNKKYNFINIDVQGYELEVFKGAEKYLNEIDYIYTEVNRDEVYKNCAQIQDIDTFLSQYHFTRVATNWKGKTWGDAFYIKNYKKEKFIQNLVRRATCWKKNNQ